MIDRIEKKHLTHSERMYDLPCSVCGKIYKSESTLGRPYLCSDKCKADLKIIKEKEAEIRKQEQIKIVIEREIPPKYLTIKTDKVDMLEKNYKNSLFITGPVGCGKTVFMASMAKKTIKSWMNIRWISYPSFIMSLQNAYKKDKESPYDMAEDVARFSGFLFIDDLAAEKLTDFVRQMTYYILNEREQYCLPTIITSNFSLDEIDQYVDSRVSSRIGGMCKVLKFSGSDRRLT